MNLRFKGAPLSDAQPLTIALNNYRATGSAGYDMFKDAKILWQSNEAIRDLIVEYYKRKKTFPSTASGNWRIIPDAARVRLMSSGKNQAQNQ